MIPTLILSAAVFVVVAWFATRHFSEYGKHSGGGDGALTVRHLLAQAAAEAASRGRHHLREPQPPPHSTKDINAPQPPPLEIQRRILDALHRL
ncbi:hypothetical protein [Saccharopolyspora hattusasensis]|uniref:hypothetical protein n=1 Tax=Saccharopolyspora hattusasensis TaxID=1128679 RepID=UPI003D991817